jgi:hypothetical protein
MSTLVTCLFSVISVSSVVQMLLLETSLYLLAAVFLCIELFVCGCHFFAAEAAPTCCCSGHGIKKVSVTLNLFGGPVTLLAINLPLFMLKNVIFNQ